jgi:hypothetical protein
MGFEINWTVSPNDDVLESPLYQKWSVKSFGAIAADVASLKADLGTVIANRDSAEIVAYLSYLLRVVTLIGG